MKMTKNPTETQFSVRISGITYEDAVTLCGDKHRKAANDWCDEDGDVDSDSEDAGVIEISIRHIDDLIELLAEVKSADDWAGIHCWDVSLHATRLMPTYSLGASLTDTGCSMIFRPERPAVDAVSKALSCMLSAMADLQVAASVLEAKQ
jgi:hypothetical protein